MSALRNEIRLNALHEIVDDLDYYQLLKLEQNCEQKEIAKAFKRESQLLHPDNSPEKLKDKATYIYTAINEAFRILKEPESRLSYDGLLSIGQIRAEDTALKTGSERSSANDPSKAAQTEQAKKYWLLALADMDAKRFDSAILNIRFAMQFEPKNEVFQEWLQKAKEESKKAPQKDKNPFKLRL